MVGDSNVSWKRTLGLFEEPMKPGMSRASDDERRLLGAALCSIKVV